MVERGVRILVRFGCGVFVWVLVRCGSGVCVFFVWCWGWGRGRGRGCGWGSSMNVIKTYRDVFISSFFARKVLALILDIVQNICHNLLFP